MSEFVFSEEPLVYNNTFNDDEMIVLYGAYGEIGDECGNKMKCFIECKDMFDIHVEINDEFLMWNGYVIKNGNNFNLDIFFRFYFRQTFNYGCKQKLYRNNFKM